MLQTPDITCKFPQSLNHSLNQGSTVKLTFQNKLFETVKSECFLWSHEDTEMIDVLFQLSALILLAYF